MDPPKQQRVRRITVRHINLLIRVPPEKAQQLVEHLHNDYANFIKISRAHAANGHTEIVEKGIVVNEVKSEDKTLATFAATITIKHRTSISYGVKPLQKNLCKRLNLPTGMVWVAEQKVPAEPGVAIAAPAPAAPAAPAAAAPAAPEPQLPPQQPQIAAPEPAMPPVPQIPTIDPVMQQVLSQKHILQPEPEPEQEKKQRKPRQKKATPEPEPEPEPLPPPKPLNYVQSEVKKIESANKPAEPKEELKPLALTRQMSTVKKVYGVRSVTPAAGAAVAPKVYRGFDGRFLSVQTKDVPKV